MTRKQRRALPRRRRPPHHLLRQCARGAGTGHGHGASPRARGGSSGRGSDRWRGRGRMTAVVPVFHPRAEPRRAVKRGYPRESGSVRLCRTLVAVERLLYQRLVDAVVLDVKAAPEAALALPARFPRIPMFVLSALRPDDGALLATCQADLLGNPGYTVRAVVKILGLASPSHLAGLARRVAGATPQELRSVGPGGVLARFVRGRTRSRA